MGKLRKIFKHSFLSAHIFDMDALVLANCINFDFNMNSEQLCAKASALSSELRNVDLEISKNKSSTFIIKNLDFIYIFSEINESLRLLMILRNNDTDFILKNVKKISEEIGKIINNAIFNENILDNFLSEFQTEKNDNLHVLNEEDILIRKIIFELKSIITPVSYKTRLINDFHSNSINVNSNNENLRLILRLIKLLKNNFAINMR